MDVSLLPVVEACVVVAVPGRVGEVRVAADEPEAVDLDPGVLGTWRTNNYSQFGFWGHTYGRVSLLPVVEACVVVRGRVCEVRVASTADEAEAIIMIVDLTLSYIWRLGNYFVRRLHYAASLNFLGGGPADQNNSKYF